MTCTRFLTRRSLALVGLLTALGGCMETDPRAGSPVREPLDRPPVAPEIVLRDVVSTELPEFGITFTPDGNTLYFSRATADRGQIRIMTSTRDANGWSSPRVPAWVGDGWHLDPYVTPDGARLYFNSNRPRRGIEATSLSTWYVSRTAAGWSAAIDPGVPLNSDATDVFVSTTTDGAVYFSSFRSGEGRIYRTGQEGPDWIEPEVVRLGSTIGVGNPLVSPDGSFIIVTVQVEGRGSDLMYSCSSEDGWTEPVALGGGVNSRFGELAPGLSPDGATFYFTSERPGIVGPQPESVRPPGDIYEVPFEAIGVSCVATGRG